MKYSKLVRAMDDLKSKKDPNETIKSNTASGYIDKILYINKMVFDELIINDVINEKNFLKFEKVKVYLETKYKSLETKRTYINSILALLRAIKKEYTKNTTKHTKIYKKYQDYFNTTVKEITNYHKTPDFKSKKCKITEEELKNKLEKLEINFYNKKNSLNLQKLILFKIYTEHITARADFVDMIITTNFNIEKVNKKYNYVDLKNGEFIIFNHKTEKQGEIILKINNDTLKLIKKLKQLRIDEDLNREIFLLSADGTPMNSHYLGVMIKRLTGCSINDLRKRHASKNATPENREFIGGVIKDAKDQGHSIETHITHYMKI
jgi:hypothetical protein